MKIPDYPGSGIRAAADAGAHYTNGLLMNDSFFGSATEIPDNRATTRSRAFTALNDPVARNKEIMSAALRRQAQDSLRDIKSQLLIDLMEKALPAWLRQRWIKMLMDLDFSNKDTGEKIERLCRECSAARGNLGRVLGKTNTSLEKKSQADTELILLTNGFNNLANQWWLLRSMPQL